MNNSSAMISTEVAKTGIGSRIQNRVAITNRAITRCSMMLKLSMGIAVAGRKRIKMGIAIATISLIFFAVNINLFNLPAVIFNFRNQTVDIGKSAASRRSFI
ncbi:MAG: hypothetical protein R3C26_13270 [Calditrichia bacterium]